MSEQTRERRESIIYNSIFVKQIITTPSKPNILVHVRVCKSHEHGEKCGLSRDSRVAVLMWENRVQEVTKCNLNQFYTRTCL